ncbi:MAG: translation elongation factor 4, partial [Candidatus Paceibacterota bacterium]
MENQKEKIKIRNFCIIAHVDHGKSTLADRMLEITNTVDKRQMKEQYLDGMESERERGITIKMAPVRMKHNDYILNLIDTPGHSDFSYEVSRALAAVEGVVLLIDASQGIQAQTIANLRVANKLGLDIVAAINKVDLFKNENDLNDRLLEVSDLLDIDPDSIYRVSGKTGEGVEELLQGVIDRISPPEINKGKPVRGLIFDSFYDNHKGVVAGVRVFDGQLKDNDDCSLEAVNKSFKIKELGFFTPQLKKQPLISTGNIGYIATGLKNPEDIRIGDTITLKEFSGKIETLPGYQEPQPVVFVSFYPEDADKYEDLGKSLQKLKLSDSSLMIDNDRNEILGRGYKVGFLGKLHYEIIEERLWDEFNMETVNSLPSVVYEVKTMEDEWIEIIRPENTPEGAQKIKEQVVDLEIIIPAEYLNDLLSIQHQFRLKDIKITSIGNMTKVKGLMPLPELISGFDETLKSISKGYGSFSYERDGFEEADVVRVDILVSKEIIPGLSRFIARDKHETEARRMVKKLKELLPKKQYAQPVQATADGKVVAREDVPAMRKDVTAGLYGGDITRKKKVLEKQKKGKKKLKKVGGAQIDSRVFKELLK